MSIKMKIYPAFNFGILMLSLSLFSIVIHGCRKSKDQHDVISEDQVEAREDSLELVKAYALQSKIQLAVTPDIETRPIRTGNVNDDAADDMALWFNQANPAKSVIIGTNKKGGIVAYALNGEEIANHTTGRINNIDIMHDFPAGTDRWDIAGCTNRSDQSIDLYRIHRDSFQLQDIAAHALALDTHKLNDVYGFCFYKSDKPYLFVNGKNGILQQYEILLTPTQQLDLKLVREIPFGSQTEGMVADEEYDVLYVGEEDKGIWRISAKADGGDVKTLIPLSNEENMNIAFDIEGLTLYKNGSAGYLIASSQGNFSYAVFDRRPGNAYLNSFKIIAGNGIDGVEETDGIEAFSSAIGAAYPMGVFVVQDGFNYDGDTLMAQNFKLVNWEKIQALLNTSGASD